MTNWTCKIHFNWWSRSWNGRTKKEQCMCNNIQLINAWLRIKKLWTTPKSSLKFYFNQFIFFQFSTHWVEAKKIFFYREFQSIKEKWANGTDYEMVKGKRRKTGRVIDNRCCNQQHIKCHKEERKNNKFVPLKPEKEIKKARRSFAKVEVD